MRITRITVTNLFGVFNHDIPLNLPEHITIIHGPNGFGKTVVLTILNSLFNSHYEHLRQLRFDAVHVYMDDGSTLRIAHDRSPSANGPEPGGPVGIQLTRADKSIHSTTVKPLSPRDVEFPLGMLEHEVPGLDRIGADIWVYEPTQERLTFDEVIERFGEQLPLPPSLRRKSREPEWLLDIKKAVKIRFIETQRLLTFTISKGAREYQRTYDRRLPLVPAVVRYSDELVAAIQSRLTEYAALSQSLDRTFPTRLVKSQSSQESSLETLRTRLGELETKRTQLMTAGLLDKEEEIDLQDLQAIEESNRNVLTVYIDDVQRKLAVFDELTTKIDLLVRLINNRFTYKRLTISKRSGFVFQTMEGKNLPATGLSSGEQHELVLLYELLFKVTPNSLILVDEPELSLHVLWQQQFLGDLQEITKIGGFDVLVATHSPQIIHDRWDLTVELKGPSIAKPSKRR